MPCCAICQTEAMLCQSDREYPSFHPSPFFPPLHQIPLRAAIAVPEPLQQSMCLEGGLAEIQRLTLIAQRSKSLAFQTAPIAL